jgi:hypothetical protein
MQGGGLVRWLNHGIANVNEKETVEIVSERILHPSG